MNLKQLVAKLVAMHAAAPLTPEIKILRRDARQILKSDGIRAPSPFMVQTLVDLAWFDLIAAERKRGLSALAGGDS